MNCESYDSLLRIAQASARNVGITFLNDYLKGYLAYELSTDKETFSNDQDFRVGLLARLFYEYRMLDIWDKISEDDWDRMCELSVLSAFEEFSHE